jgi:hypothetical protein
MVGVLGSLGVVLITAIGLPAGAESVTQQKYDLNCRGPISISTPNGFYTKAEIIRLHIDLRKRQWCDDDCRYIKPISSVSDGMLEFGQVDYPAWGVIVHPEGTATVNRLTGVYSLFVTTGKIISSGDLKCDKAPFTPFPVQKF